MPNPNEKLTRSEVIHVIAACNAVLAAAPRNAPQAGPLESARNKLQRMLNTKEAASASHGHS